MRTTIALVALLSGCMSAVQPVTGDAGSGAADAAPDTGPACDDGTACTVDTGALGACVYTPDNSACEAGERCLVGLGCVLGGCTTRNECDDGIDCTIDSCDVGNVCGHRHPDGC